MSRMDDWHVPGPLEVKKTKEGWSVVFQSARGALIMADCYQGPKSEERAHLFAAAPDMVEALRECVDTLKLHGYQSCDGVAWGEAALAKALYNSPEGGKR